MKFKLMSDGACDLGTERAAALGVEVIPFYVSFDSENYYREIEELDIRKFYQQMIDAPGIYPKTSTPSVQDYVEHFEPYAKQGQPVLCICITEKLSGSYNAARLAAEQVREDYPEAQIRVWDSKVITVLQGMVVEQAARLRDQGLSLNEACARLERMRQMGRIFFTIDNLDYLVHGGRVGKVLKVAGSRLKIRPLITFKDGDISPSGVAMGRGSSIKKLESVIASYLEKEKAKLSRLQMVVGFGYDKEEGESFLKNITAELRKRGCDLKLELRQIGATIAVHTGPLPLGIGMLEVVE